MNPELKILLIEDDEDDFVMTRDMLADVERQKYALEWVKQYDDGLAAMKKSDFDVCLIDYRLGQYTGLDLLRQMIGQGCQTPLILLTGQFDREIDSEAMKSGAADYLIKQQMTPLLLDRAIHHAIERKQAEEKLRSLNETLELQNKEMAESRHRAFELMEQAENAKAEAEIINKRLAVSVEQADMMAREALQASKAKSEFLANMSHEIRTPLNAIIGFTDILISEELTEDQKSYVEIICNAGNNLLALINDILDFSKIEAGKLNTEFMHYSLDELLEFAEASMKPDAEKKGLNYSVRRCTELPATIYTDPTRLRQCLINLLSNAIKFTEAGYVRLEVYSETRGPSQSIRFDVADSGIGIAKDKLNMVFESFAQADGSTTRKFGGTGLGLAITKSLAELLGGGISVESELGKGANFSLIVPSGAPAAEVLPTKGAEAESSLNCESGQQLSGRVLIAEDTTSNQLLTKTLVERMGFEAVIVDNGQKAVDAVDAESFDLILMDMQMPVMNGYQAVRTLRSRNIDIPIIALTANAMTGDAARCMEAGCDDYLAKPISYELLNKIIRKHFPAKKVAGGKNLADSP